MKNKTVICHFYNEEYLLPWWLKHHREIFEQGLMINYGSNDNSVNIIKELCPSWTIVDSKNKFFDSFDIDREIEEYERSIDGYRIVLNITEFLIGNISKLYTHYNGGIIVPMISMMDNKEQEGSYPDPNVPLTKQRLFGISPHDPVANGFLVGKNHSGSRLLHQDKNIKYPVGRHYWHVYNPTEFYILRYKHAPWNDAFIKRKMQIGKKQSEEEVKIGWGVHHRYNRDQLQQELLEYRRYMTDISSMINHLEYISYEK